MRGAVRIRRGTALAVALLLVALLTAIGSPRAAAATETPTGLAARAVARTAVSLTWNAVPGAPKYRIQYSTRSSMSGATYLRFVEPSGEISGLKANTTYYVKVRVISADGDNLSPYSKAIKVVTASTTAKTHLPPVGLAVSRTAANEVDVTWSARASGVGYRVRWSTSSSMSDAPALETTTASATIESLRASTSYWIWVRVIDGDGDSLSDYSSTIKVTTKATNAVGSQSLRVGSFNVKCANCFSGLPNEGTWYERRDTVVAQIKRQDLDVLGVQEASQGWLKDADGDSIDLSQFEDLRNRLGGSWRLANDKRNNCVKSTTPSNCEYKDQGASQGTKILFDNDTVALVRSGSKKLSSASGNPRYVAWALLRQRSTGSEFMFADTHLQHGSDAYDLRITETKELLAIVEDNNPDDLPVIVVGDFNSHKWSDPKNAPYDLMLQAGLVDPLGNFYESTSTTRGATVEKRIRTNLSSYSDFERKAPLKTWVNGTYLDYILTTPMRVSEWETVADLDANGNYVGTIASDHHLVRATVWIPASE